MAGARSLDRHNLQPFRPGELRLPVAGGQEQFALKGEGAGDVDEVDCTRAQTFGVTHREVGGVCKSGVHVERHVKQGAAGG